jgi:Domain of unknown function (DUF6438)
MKKHPFLVILLVVVTACSSQKKSNSPEAGLKFEKLVFHSSRCNGTCPKIDFQIDSSRNILLTREFFLNKSEKDTVRSGTFKGVLSSQQLNELLEVLESSKYNNLVFPDITCCDGVITTIIIYANGKRKYLKSMKPPATAAKLIEFLYKTGTEVQLARSGDAVKLEE